MLKKGNEGKQVFLDQLRVVFDLGFQGFHFLFQALLLFSTVLLILQMPLDSLELLLGRLDCGSLRLRLEKAVISNHLVKEVVSSQLMVVALNRSHVLDLLQKTLENALSLLYLQEATDVVQFGCQVGFLGSDCELPFQGDFQEFDVSSL